MNRLYLLLTFTLLCSCSNEQLELQSFPIPADPANAYAHLFRNGKHRNAPRQSQKFMEVPLDSLPFPTIDLHLAKALTDQDRLLGVYSKMNYRTIGGERYTREDFREVVQILKRMQLYPAQSPEQELRAYQIEGVDGLGHVRYTAYFTPQIPVSRKQDSIYRFPIYRRPQRWEGQLPSRAEIDGDGLLKNQGLEIAYASSLVDIYYMQLQGSGYVHYSDGSRQLLAYDGSNRHPYRSIETYALSRPDLGITSVTIGGLKAFLRSYPQFQDTLLFQNPSYTFFKPLDQEPTGAGGVPLTAEISLAVDHDHLPMGSCLLAEVPVYDAELDRVIGHDYKIFLAQDVGGAIRGSGHVDWYQGVGKEAQHKAQSINYFGRLWLLLPRYKTTPKVYIKK